MRTQTESIARRAAKDITKGYDIKVRIEMAIEQALAQRTEPVGVMVSMDVSKGDEPEYRIFGRIYEVMKDGEGKDEVTYLAIEDSRNFDTPPQRTWVGLTMDEIALLHANYLNPQGFALALQAKLKERNT